MVDLWQDLRDPDFLRGVVYRHDSQIKEHRALFLTRLNEVRSELIDEVRAVRRAVEERDDWRETTAVRTQRRTEIERARTRGRRWAALIGPAVGALLYALAELVRTFASHH